MRNLISNKQVIYKYILYISIIGIIGFAFAGCKDKDSEITPFNDPYVAKINSATTFQTIRGFGGATVFIPAGGLPNANDMNTLFGNGNNQIGLSILRIRVASDDDPSWRATELTHALQAKANGAIVIASPWSPPARMKTNKNLIGGSLIVDSSANFATYLNNFSNYMTVNNAELYAISIQNEPDIRVSYESCDWTAGQIKDFLKNYGNLITSTKVIAPESFHFDQHYIDTILNDAGAAANLDIVGGHIYGSGLANYANALNNGKELWMTEHYTNTDDANIWSSATGVAKEIHDCMTIGQYSAYIWWYLKRFYGPLGEDGIITKRGWIMANFSKFIRPGYQRISVNGNFKTGVNVSAYNGGKLVIVALNLSNTEVSQTFLLENNASSTATPYTTSVSLNLRAGSAISIRDSGFKFTLPSQSVTTFVVE